MTDANPAQWSFLFQNSDHVLYVMLVEETDFLPIPSQSFLTPSQSPEVSLKYLDLVSVQAIGDVQLPFHVQQSFCLKSCCVFVYYHADMHGTPFRIQCLNH